MYPKREEASHSSSVCGGHTSSYLRYWRGTGRVTPNRVLESPFKKVGGNHIANPSQKRGEIQHCCNLV